MKNLLYADKLLGAKFIAPCDTLNNILGKTVKNDAIVFNNYRNRLFAPKQKLAYPFFLAKDVFFESCEQEFLKEILTNEIFPNVKNIYFNNDNFTKIYVGKNYAMDNIFTPIQLAHIPINYPLNWRGDFVANNVHIIDADQYHKEVDKYTYVGPWIDK